MKTRSCAVVVSAISALFMVACGGPAVADTTPSVAAAAPPESAEGTVQYVVEGLLQHEPQRIWTALPDRYRNDVNGIISDLSAKMDADVYNRAFQLLGRVGALLDDKKELFLDSQMFPGQVDREDAAANWDSMTATLRTLASSEISRLEGLANLNVESFLANTGAKLLANAEKAARETDEDLFENLRNLQVEVVEQDEGRASLRLSGAAEEAMEIELARVDGRWVPAEMAAEWDSSISRAREQIAGMSREQMQAMKPQLLGVFGMLEGTLAQLEAAETRQQLDQALQVAMFSVMGVVGAAMQGMQH